MSHPISELLVSGTGLLLARLVLGLAMASHGAQKLFGWFGGYGLAGTGGFMASIGFRPGKPMAAAAGVAELAGGLLVSLGFLGPAGPALVVMVMLVAALAVHRANGFYATSNGVELNVIYIVAALALAFAGPGPLSLDTLLDWQGLDSPILAALAVGAAVLLAGLNLAARRLPAAAAASEKVSRPQAA